MNLTDEQKDLLRKIVQVYVDGCHSPFIFVQTLSDAALVYAGHPSVPVEANITDFRRLQAEGLIDCIFDGQGATGKPTANSIGLVERNFEDRKLAVFPLEIESQIKTLFYVIIDSDTSTEESVAQLITLMFQEPEASFYYFQATHATSFLSAAIERRDIVEARFDRHYYAHPTCARDFVHIAGASNGEYHWDWERLVVEKGPEYTRRTLKLSERKRRELESFERIHLEHIYREHLKMEGIQTDVFLSYAKTDQTEADTLHQAIISAGRTCFLAAKSLIPGDDFADTIRAALRASREVWLLVSPDSMRSEWVTTEWGAAWALHKEIVPILLRCSFEQLPSRLRSLHGTDFHKYPELIERRLKSRDSKSEPGLEK